MKGRASWAVGGGLEVLGDAGLTSTVWARHWLFRWLSTAATTSARASTAPSASAANHISLLGKLISFPASVENPPLRKLLLLTLDRDRAGERG